MLRHFLRFKQDILRKYPIYLWFDPNYRLKYNKIKQYKNIKCGLLIQKRNLRTRMNLLNSQNNSDMEQMVRMIPRSRRMVIRNSLWVQTKHVEGLKASLYRTALRNECRTQTTDHLFNKEDPGMVSGPPPRSQMSDHKNQTCMVWRPGRTNTMMMATRVKVLLKAAERAHASVNHRDLQAKRSAVQEAWIVLQWSKGWVRLIRDTTWARKCQPATVRLFEALPWPMLASSLIRET